MRRLAALIFVLAIPAFAQEQPPFIATIEVVRYALDVRVIDSSGKGIEDLTPEDFTVMIGKSRATVESATWVAQGQRVLRPESFSEEEELPEGEVPEEQEEVTIMPAQRSIVILIQTDFARVSKRVSGQMKFNYFADKILKLLGPTDRVAVFSHDSHLKFRRDFTTDRESISKAVRECLFINTPPLPAASTDGASLLPFLDPKEMKRAAHAEAALLVLANAIHNIEGEKLIIIGGWGIGELQGRAGVQLKHQWKDAVETLNEDRVPVITLGTGLGAQLTAGLKATAEATGGFYADTQSFAYLALNRLEGTLSGHYELTLSLDEDLEPGRHNLNVRVARKDAQVQAPTYVEQP